MTDKAGARVRELILRRLGGDSAVRQLVSEAEHGEVGERTRRRAELALEDAVARDALFAEEFQAAMSAANAQFGSALGHNHTVTINGSAYASGGISFGAVGRDVVMPTMPVPGSPDRDQSTPYPAH
ncbi:hypothetical protein ACFQ68_16735 [Amycolatopsis japonica]|uniref:hypothetical protein n=1 Tax=Amycolatopsis japonica TaxID=208439 RepID=UPI00366B312A